MATTSYISIGANRSSSCAVATVSGVFAFGAGSTVALWDMAAPGGVYATLLGHAGEVTTIKRVREENGKTTIVSGDSVGGVRVWAEGEDKQVRSSVHVCLVSVVLTPVHMHPQRACTQGRERVGDRRGSEL